MIDMEMIKKLLSEQLNITTIVAVLGLILSVLSWVDRGITHRRNISMSIHLFKAHSKMAYMYLMVENKSQLPISITNISIIEKKSYFRVIEKSDCVKTPKEVVRTIGKSGAKVIKTDFKYSTAIPVQLPALQAVSCIVLFENLPKEIPRNATQLNLQICTNRGSPMKMTLQLPEAWADRNDIP